MPNGWYWYNGTNFMTPTGWTFEHHVGPEEQAYQEEEEEEEEDDGAIQVDSSDVEESKNESGDAALSAGGMAFDPCAFATQGTLPEALGPWPSMPPVPECGHPGQWDWSPGRWLWIRWEANGRAQVLYWRHNHDCPPAGADPMRHLSCIQLFPLLWFSSMHGRSLKVDLHHAWHRMHCDQDRDDAESLLEVRLPPPSAASLEKGRREAQHVSEPTLSSPTLSKSRVRHISA